MNFGTNKSLKCVFEDKSSSPAIFSGILPSGNRTLFKCVLPYTIRRRLPFTSPVLTKSDDIPAASNLQVPVMMRWSFLAYDSFSTESDVVVFAKGVNNRQGINRLPETLNCVFGDDISKPDDDTAQFLTDFILREQYRDPWNEVRIGKLLEDLDALAGTITVKHCADENLTTRPLLLVTASVDRIVLKKPASVVDLDITGVVVWVGRS